MKRGSMRAWRVAAVTMVVMLTAGCGSADSAPDAASSGPPASDQAPASTQAVMADLGRTVGIAHEKLVSLAEAMPPATWDWRPMDGVRSVGEVYQHVAADNWFGPALMGIPSPEGVGVTAEGETVGAYQDRAMTREEIIQELERSFEHLEAALEAVTPRAHEEVSLRGNTLTTADLTVRLIVHMHEHLGQAVAYARANEVVPPWSR